MIVPLTIQADAPSEYGRTREPVTVGVPFPKGTVAPMSLFRVVGADGVECPCDAHVLDRWSDGSARWILVEFQASLPAGANWAAAQLHSIPPSQAAAPQAAGDALRIVQAPGAVDVDTGAAIFTLSTKATGGIEGVRTEAG